MGRRRGTPTLDRMAQVVAVLQEDDGLTTAELFDTLGGSMNYSHLQAAIRYLLRDGDVIRVSNEDWGTIVHLIDGRDDVFPGAGHLYFLDALAGAA